METIKIPANSEVIDYITCKTQTTANIKCGMIIPFYLIYALPIVCPMCGRGTN